MTPHLPRPLTRARGFTLIEMLVVLAIVALLLSVATPRYFGSLEKGREVALQENLRVLRVTLDKFHADKGRYPDTLDELVEARYLREVPLDPITEVGHDLGARAPGKSPASRAWPTSRAAPAAAPATAVASTPSEASGRGMRRLPHAASPTSGCSSPWPSWAWGW